MLDRLKSLFRPKAAEPEAISPQAASLLGGLATGFTLPRRGTQEMIIAYREMPGLRRIVQRIAESFAAIEWQVFRGVGIGGTTRNMPSFKSMGFDRRLKAATRLRQAGELELLEESPIVQFIEAGNPCLTGFTCRQIMQSHFELLGEAMAWIERNDFGMPIQYWPLNPVWIRNVPQPGGSGQFVVSVQGREMKIPASEMIFIKDPDPWNPYGRGTGIGFTLADELDSDEYAAKFVSAFFSNGAMPDGLIMFENASKDEIERVRRDWENQHRGHERAHRLHFLNQKAEIAQFQKSLRDMTMVDLRKFLRSIVRETWGVPPEVVGEIENSNRSTIEAASFIFSKWIIVPRAERWRIELQRQIIPLFDGREILDYASPVPEDREFILRAYQAAPHTIERAEWRELQGLETHGDVDSVYVQPFGLFERPVSIAEPVQPPTIQSPPQLSASPEVKQRSPFDLSDIDRILMAVDPDELGDRLSAFWPDEIERQANREFERLGVRRAPNLDPKSDIVAAHVRNFAGERMANVNETTKRILRAQLSAGIEAGEDLDQLAARVRSTISDMTIGRSMVVARTEVYRSANFATQAAQVRSGIVRRRRWVTVQDGGRHHAAGLHGIEAGLIEPFVTPVGVADHPGEFGDPAQDINCFLPDTEVEGSFVAGVRSMYSGDALEIETRSGRRLRVTPNHKILTSKGFVAAKLLRKGCDIISHRTDLPASSKHENVENGPTAIDQVFRSLRNMFSSSRVGITRVDFNGDERLCEGEVEIVRPDRLLQGRVEASVVNGSHQFSFVSSYPRRTDLPSRRTALGFAAGDFSTFCGRPGSRALSNDLGSAFIRPLEKLSFGSSSNPHASVAEVSHESGTRDPAFVGKLFERSPGSVFIDQVVEIRDIQFCGHVYDLQSTSGWLIASGIVASNCRCSVQAIVDEKAVQMTAKDFEDEIKSWSTRTERGINAALRAQQGEVVKELRSIAARRSVDVIMPIKADSYRAPV